MVLQRFVFSALFMKKASFPSVFTEPGLCRAAPRAKSNVGRILCRLSERSDARVFEYFISVHSAIYGFRMGFKS